MDFLDPKKKRAHTIRLFVGYVLVTVAILLAATLLLFVALGYGIKRSTGEVTQNGLVFVDAHPQQANITINGQDRGKTDGRFVFEAGNYSVQLSRDGYRSWSKDIVVEGGGIVRLVYPFLFPTQLQTTALTTATVAPDVVSGTPDRRWIIMHSPDALTTFQVIDTSTEKNTPSSISVPAAIFGTHTGAQKLEFVEWSTDNRHVLLKHNFEGGYDYLIIDREKPEASLNVSQVMGKSYSEVTLHNKKSDELYAQDAAGGTLQLVSLKAKTATTVASNVQAFWPYKDTNVLYTTLQGASSGKVVLHLIDGQSNYTIRELTAGPKYLLNMAEFDGDTYVAAASTADGRLYIYKNPLDTLKRADDSTIALLLLKLDNPDAITFSANARFIALQAGSKFEVYDAETKLQYRYDTKLTLPAGQKANWMDGHRLMLISEGTMRVFDFDGLNMQTLTAASQAFVPLFDRDYEALFTYGPHAADAAKSGLSRTELIVNKNQ